LMSKITVVGIGPGGLEEMSLRAAKAIEESDIVIGYRTYTDLIKSGFPQKPIIASAMTREVERCELALAQALSGRKVALISGGDSGIYGMAGIMLEVVQRSGKTVAVEVVPGITAASAAAAVLGAPLMHDFAVISLSDRLTPLDAIYQRVECAARGDFVICLYNPKSQGRAGYIETARDIILQYRSAVTPVGIVRDAGRENQEFQVATLETMLDFLIDMSTVVIIGNSGTYIADGRMITPRGYKL
jgi:precorrin-3B C17-methyltransferase